MKYSSATLHYYFLRGPIRFEGLRVLSSLETEWNDCPLTARVLGTSHAFSLELGGELFTELLSCAPGTPDSRVLAQILLSGPFSIGLRIGGLSYQFRMECYSLDENDSLSGSYGPECRLEVAYPGEDDSRTPVTRIGWRQEPDRLEVETVHTYPEEGKRLRSESRFELL